jgi:TldD protein
MDGHDLSEHAVDFALGLGADFVESRHVKEANEGYSMRNGEIMSAGRRSREGTGVRLLVDGSVGFCSSDSDDRRDLERSITAAYRMASAASRRSPVVLSEEEVHEDRWETEVSTPFGDVDQDQKVGFLSRMDGLVSDVDRRVGLRNFYLELVRWDKHLVTSEGARIDGLYSLFSLRVMFQVEDDGKSEQRRFGIGGTGGWEWAEGETIPDRLVDDASRTVEVVDRARAIDLGVTDVVVGAEVAGIIAHENCGHPSEGDRILGREAAQAGESWYADLELGESKIGSDALTIVDDPTMDGNAGYYLYDDEGVRAGPRYLIKEGVLNQLLLNREFAHRYGTHSTASARAIGYDREPIIRMANTYISPGDFSEEEVIEDVKRGVYMRNFTEWNIDDRRFQSKYVGSEARLIEDGELTDTLVRRPVLELTTRGLFESVDACSTGFEADLATCGKSDPMQGAPVWTAGPAAVRLRDIRVGVGR